MNNLNNFSGITGNIVTRAAEQYGTPLYLYDEAMIIARCHDCLNMPNAFGLTVRYAMKANSTRALLRIIDRSGILIDASSLGEAKRARLAGIAPERIMITTQEVPEGAERNELEELLLSGAQYNVCSLRQLSLIADFAHANNLPLSIRVHPGVGSGETATRNTGDNYSCFGVHLTDLEQAIAIASQHGITLRHVHVHIGSGADPEVWRRNIDLELGIIERYFPEADTVSFGGGLKEARMPDERAADIQTLGEYAKLKIEDYHRRTGRKLHMEVEPGTYIVANSGYAVTRVLDKKATGPSGFNFVVLDGGMEINARPLLYASRHPLYIIDRGGRVMSSEFLGRAEDAPLYRAVIAGKCCESGDCQTLGEDGHGVPRNMAEPSPGDFAVIGGVGAYCSSMTPFNYNSHTQIAEVLLTESGDLRLIRKRQTLEQMVENELD